MRIGILTLHSQTNYGGVLQAYALQRTLESLGYEVVIIDRWMTEDDGFLKGIFSSCSIDAWVKFLGRSLIGCGDFSHLIRCRRTLRKMPVLLNRTDYGFYHWQDAPRDLGVDMLVVGSDQVWNPSLMGSEMAYLLKDAPSMPAISVAASFGVGKLPKGLEEPYRKGLQRFRAISVREAEGAGIVEALGYKAEHVVDPVLLADRGIWSRFEATCDKKKRRLFCYLIHVPLGVAVGRLRRFAQDVDCEVDVFVGGPCVLPKDLKTFGLLVTGVPRAKLASRIHVCTMATPDEFVRAVANADYVVTDSFHGLMFSIVYRKNVRILTPVDGKGVQSFARLSECAVKYFRDDILAVGLDAALKSLSEGREVRYEEGKIELDRKRSMDWVRSAIEMCR